MDIEVPDTVKQETTRCRHNFACLNAEGCRDHGKCKIDYSGGKNVLILAVSEEYFSGPYSLSFGDRQLCACPVRYYLYKTGF